MRNASGWLVTLRSCWVFPAAVVWKLGLAFAFALPPPANDAFFFDGAVVNWLLHGRYVNPSIGRVFPTSATEFFSAYLPGYQAVLAPWMWLFGPTVEASLGLHCTLFSVYALLALAVVRRAGVPALAANVGGCFLFGLTFHDRPDSVAHVVGLLAFWLWTTPDAARAGRGRALGAVCAVLSLATSLHIGAMYSAMLWGHAALRAKKLGWPWRSMLAVAIVPILLATLVIKGSPTAWQGFQESLITQSSTRFRLPTLDEILRAARNTPGLIVVTVFLFIDMVRRRPALRSDEATTSAVASFGALLVAADFAILASLFVAPPYYVAIAAYPQIVVVALWVWLRTPLSSTAGAVMRSARAVALPGAIALVALRAVALATWGVLCATDVGKVDAIAEVRRTIDSLPDRAEVIVSSAYLYDLAGQQRVNTIHTDWIGRYGEPGGAHPVAFVLTPFDYYRRFRRELAAMQAKNQIKSLTVREKRRWPVPDETPSLQRVVQHLSWAPVIVRVEWR